MREISLSEFKTLSGKESFIFFFSMENYGCGTCRLYEKEISKYNIPNLIKVLAENEEDLMEMNIMALPYTCTYNQDGSIKVKKYGVLYEKQVKELLNG